MCKHSSSLVEHFLSLPTPLWIGLVQIGFSLSHPHGAICSSFSPFSFFLLLSSPLFSSLLFTLLPLSSISSILPTVDSSPLTRRKPRSRDISTCPRTSRDHRNTTEGLDGPIQVRELFNDYNNGSPCCSFCFFFYLLFFHLVS